MRIGTILEIYQGFFFFDNTLQIIGTYPKVEIRRNASDSHAQQKQIFLSLMKHFEDVFPMSVSKEIQPSFTPTLLFLSLKSKWVLHVVGTTVSQRRNKNILTHFSFIIEVLF